MRVSVVYCVRCVEEICGGIGRRPPIWSSESIHSIVMPAMTFQNPPSPMAQETPCSFAGVRSDAIFSSINELYAAESRVRLRRALYMARNPYCDLEDEERDKMFRTGTVVLHHLQAEFHRMRPPKPPRPTLCEC